MTCGIYKITNVVNNKSYIGKSVNIEERWQHHKTSERRRYPNKLLYKAFDKYGLNNFTFEIIEECQKQELEQKEKFWIKHYHTCVLEKDGYGYNCTFGGDGFQTGGGENSATPVLTQKEVLSIQSQLLQGIPIVEISKKFPQVGYNCIYNINIGKTWHNDNFTYPLKKYSKNHKFTDIEIEAIRELYFNQSYSQKEIAQHYNCSIDTIRNILKNRTYIDKNFKSEQAGTRLHKQFRRLSNQEVLQYRMEVYKNHKKIYSLWNASDKKIGYAAFRNMIRGITYPEVGGIPNDI